MVDVRPVDVRVAHGTMDMVMVVRESALPFRMLVIVMLVVAMRMGMSHFLMRVAVPVQFQVQKGYPREHQHSGDPVRRGRSLSQKRHREERAEERTDREEGGGSRRADLPQGLDEKDQAQPVAEGADSQGPGKLRKRCRSGGKGER